MSFLRLLSAAAAFLACALFGAVRKRRYSESLNELYDINSDLKLLAQYIGRSRMPLSDAAKALVSDGKCTDIWSAVSVKLSEGKDFFEAFTSSRKHSFCEEAESMTAQLLSGIGTGDAETELNRLSALTEGLDALLEDLRKDYAVKSKLAVTLSLFMGLALALLIL